MPQEVEYTLARHPASEYAKINEALCDWYVLAASKKIFHNGPQMASKLTHEVLINFMLCHCVVDYSDIQ